MTIPTDNLLFCMFQLHKTAFLTAEKLYFGENKNQRKSEKKSISI